MEKLKDNLITILLIAVNIVVFFLVEFTGNSQDSMHMLRWGAAYPPFITEQKEYYRLFTCMFLHFGIEHLLNNMIVIGVMGERLETVLGKLSFLLIYLLGGAGGNCVSLYLSLRTGNYAVAAGASGAAFSLVGAMLYAILRNKGRIKDLTLRRIGIMIAFSIYLGVAAGGVDNAAHIGGLISGFLLAVILYHPAKDENYGRII